MNFESCVLAIFGLVAFTLTGVFGNVIYCYECNSYTEHLINACEDPMYSNIPIKNCGSGYVCSKVMYVTQNISVTKRSCDLETSNTCESIETDLRIQYSDLSSYKCNTCKTDYCNKNSGVALVISLVTVLCGAAFIKILQ